MGPKWNEMPVSRNYPFHVPPTGYLRDEMLRLQSQWFIRSFTSVRVPKITHPTKWEKYIVTVQGAQSGKKANIQCDVVWFAMEIVH